MASQAEQEIVLGRFDFKTCSNVSEFRAGPEMTHRDAERLHKRHQPAQVRPADGAARANAAGAHGFGMELLVGFGSGSRLHGCMNSRKAT